MMNKKLFIQLAKLLAVKISKWCQINLTKQELSDAFGWLVILVIGLLISLIFILVTYPTPKTSSPTTHQIYENNVQINNIKVNKQVNMYNDSLSSSPNAKNSPLIKK